jgi:hypothetical protein
MTLSETGLVLLFLGGLTGLIMVLATGDPVMPEEAVHQELSRLEELEMACGEVIYGSLPRESFAGDTTVLTMDLDRESFTPAQANLHLTRALARTGIDHLSTTERTEGGLTFTALLDDGRPLRLELKY